MLLQPGPAPAAPAPPANTAHLLIQKARSLGRAGQLDSARQAASQAPRLSQQLGYGAGQARALYTLGKLEMQPGNLPAAHRYLDAAVTQAQALPRPSALLAGAGATAYPLSRLGLLKPTLLFFRLISEL